MTMARREMRFVHKPGGETVLVKWLQSVASGYACKISCAWLREACPVSRYCST